MLEFILCFPLVLTLIFGAAQFAHLWLARQVVSYAAYCAARAALVCHESEYQQAAQQAAERVCAWIVVGQGASEPPEQVPGWGAVPGSGSVGRKTRVKVEKLDDWNIKATVSFDFGLAMPIVGPIIGWGVNPWQAEAEWLEQRADPTGDQHRQLDLLPYPHLRFEETAILAKPYKTLAKMGVPVATPAAVAATAPSLPAFNPTVPDSGPVVTTTYGAMSTGRTTKTIHTLYPDGSTTTKVYIALPHGRWRLESQESTSTSTTTGKVLTYEQWKRSQDKASTQVLTFERSQ